MKIAAWNGNSLSSQLAHLVKRGWTTIAIFLLAIALKAQLLDFQCADYIRFVSPWVLYIRRHGLWAYGDAFSNYAPLYTYFLGIGVLLFPYLSVLYLVKVVTFAGECFAAIYIYKIVALHRRQGGRGLPPSIAAATLLLTPSVLSDGAPFGQCDIWYTAFLLAMTYYLLRRRFYMTLIYFGLGISFKLQAIFLTPLLLTYVLKRKVPWRGLWIPPAIYLLTCVPAWLEGRPFLNLLFIYWPKHIGSRVAEPWIAANMYVYLKGFNANGLLVAGLLLTAELAFAIAYCSCRRWHKETSALDCVLLATLCAGLMPFVLPGMFNRYFFAADIFSFLLACLRPRWFIIAALFQLSSLLTTLDFQIASLATWLWGPLAQPQRLQTALWLNVLALAITFRLCQRYIWRPPALEATT